jgi:selenocysteine lyase/cysteine desulfurase
MSVVSAYERDLVAHLLDMLETISGIIIYGITDRTRLNERVPTVTCTLDGVQSEEVARQLGAQHVYVWHGDYYAVEIMERLGHSQHGMVRIGLSHYNTRDEIDRLGDALRTL